MSHFRQHFRCSLLSSCIPKRLGVPLTSNVPGPLEAGSTRTRKWEASRILAVAATLIAFLALVASIYSARKAAEANEISRKANAIATDQSRPNIRIVGERSPASVRVSACEMPPRVPWKYRLTSSAEWFVMIANNGGRAVSLIGATFLINGNVYSDGLRVRDPAQQDETHNRAFPMEIDSGRVLSVEFVTSDLQVGAPEGWDRQGMSAFASRLISPAETELVLAFSDGSSMNRFSSTTYFVNSAAHQFSAPLPSCR